MYSITNFFHISQNVNEVSSMFDDGDFNPSTGKLHLPWMPARGKQSKEANKHAIKLSQILWLLFHSDGTAAAATAADDDESVRGWQRLTQCLLAEMVECHDFNGCFGSWSLASLNEVGGCLRTLCDWCNKTRGRAHMKVLTRNMNARHDAVDDD